MNKKRVSNKENDLNDSVPVCECNPCSAYNVEAILSIDERGQMVLPKDVREKAGIKTGTKLALISWEKDGGICCLALIRAENLNGMVKEVLEPLMHKGD
ncbi:HgcAB-associated protein HgcC [uncultured Methanomethylovorans sp.]|jgi:antitoxin PrlF|uniref:HgcAB-associated protein HgcC n=1 Tax=uncultured Methanomethylovorans sp. TaxID=183759 RepID=UPI002AA61946|nr:HgcAB-associated protein [uncultured Methanomethylovorans sp.]